MLVMVSCDFASIRLGIVCWLPQAEAKFGRQSTARSFLAENYVRVLRILKHPNVGMRDVCTSPPPSSMTP